MVRIPTLSRSAEAEAQVEKDKASDERDRALAARADSQRTVVRPVTATAPVVTAPAPVAGRPRASGLAMLSLIFGVGGAFLVLTGVLATLGVAIGVLGLLFGIGGLSATRRSHVAGRFEAMLGTLLSLGTMVVGVLAMSDMISWLNTDTNYVTQLDDWLVARIPWLERF